jgi:hypothetical protein
MPFVSVTLPLSMLPTLFYLTLLRQAVPRPVHFVPYPPSTLVLVPVYCIPVFFQLTIDVQSICVFLEESGNSLKLAGSSILFIGRYVEEGQ